VQRRTLLDTARVQFARKPVRYMLVSVVAVATSQAVLITCNGFLGWEPVPSNVTAVTISSVPSYLLNRAWVWGKRGGHRLTREVIPFWVMGLLGLALSTLFVHLAARWSDATPVISAANLTAFGLLWVAKYFVLDNILFGGHHPSLEEDDFVLAPSSE
jgi:putative flippase GtrA